jgi:hypothetical protein
MSIHVFPKSHQPTESCRSEEEVSPHLRRYRPATSDRLLASTASIEKDPGLFKSWQRLPVVIPDNVLPTSRRQGQRGDSLEQSSASGTPATC